MSLSAHPCRVIVLATIAFGALALSATPARAELPHLGDPTVGDARDHGMFQSAVAMISVPEPGILVSLFGGMGVLLGLQRFRHRK